MSEVLQSLVVQCPYCGEAIELWVDPSAGAQRYVEDCSVCCRPIECRVEAQDGECRLEVWRDDE